MVAEGKKRRYRKFKDNKPFIARPESGAEENFLIASTFAFNDFFCAYVGMVCVRACVCMCVRGSHSRSNHLSNTVGKRSSVRAAIRASLDIIRTRSGHARANKLPVKRDRVITCMRSGLRDRSLLSLSQARLAHVAHVYPLCTRACANI